MNNTKTSIVSVDLNNLELTEFIAKDYPTQHCKATFPLIGAHGSKKLATVYFELAPGDNLGRHTDSAEELLVVLEGELEIIVGNEAITGSTGSIVLVPEMVPHDMKNTGTGTARILGVFGGKNNIVASFDNDWSPTNSNVVDTSLL